MVLPPTEVALRQQTRKLTRIHRKASNNFDGDTNLLVVQQAKEEAQRVAEETFERLSLSNQEQRREKNTSNRISSNSNKKKKYKKKKHKKTEGKQGGRTAASSSSTSRSHNSVAASSNDSVESAEIAIRRGSMRAMTEENERGDDDDVSSAGSQQSGVGFDLTTITETETVDRSGTKKKSKARDFLKLFTKKSVSLQRRGGNPIDRIALKRATPLLSARAGIGKECWMCGCCGKVFATFDSADNHERKCIQTIIDELDQGSLAVHAAVGEDEDEDDHESKHIQGKTDRKPPAKPLGVPKEVLQSVVSSSSSLPQYQQSTTASFAAAQATFLNDSEQAAYTAFTPARKTNIRKKSDRKLLEDVGLEGYPEATSQSTFLYASARSLQPGMPSPWESTKKGFSSEMAVDDDGDNRSINNRNTISPGISRVSFRANNDDTTKMQLGSPTSMLSSRVIPRRRLTSSFEQDNGGKDDEALDILLTRSMRHQIIMTDEALVNSVQRASEIVLTASEKDAEKDLGYICNDKQYYDDMALRASKFKAHPMSKFRTDGDNAISKIQNKFVDAWQLIKDGDKETELFRDQYEKKNRGNDGANMDLVHDSNTHYVNVVVRHSVKVVNNEIERLAGNRWKDQRSTDGEVVNDNFEQFRKFAHVNLIKLAKMALSVDFTPRKVSIQLSNDLYRLMAPQLKRRGVIIETEIEYRVGPYFVLAVNIKSIQWSKLIKYSHRVVTKRYKQWIADQDRRDELREELAIEEGLPIKGRINYDGVRGFVMHLGRLFLLTKIELLAQFLSWMYYVHWTISTPLCVVIYRFFMRSTTRKYILTSVADEIFSYVEEKGMEMEIGIVEAEKQAAFMLSALREVREGSKALKKQKDETEDKGVIVGPLLGPAIKSDKGPAPTPPVDFEMPENLDMVNFEIDLPVGFKRLRWAMLSPKASFSRDALFAESKYKDIILNDWSRHNEAIGTPTLPDSVKEEDIVGAERESQYLMPKSGFVGANTAYDTSIITAYNDYCFSIKKRTLSPEVPYGSTFVTWTQMIFTNTGNDGCHLVCSVEAEFPNGPPMISGQIKSGMRAGTAVSFVLMGEIIIRYADEFP